MTETERGSIEKDPLCARVRAIRPQLRESGAYSTLVLSLYRKRDTGQLVMLHLLGRYAAGRTASDNRYASPLSTAPTASADNT